MDDSTPLWILLGKGNWRGEEGREGGRGVEGGDNKSHRPSLSAARWGTYSSLRAPNPKKVFVNKVTSGANTKVLQKRHITG